MVLAQDTTSNAPAWFALAGALGGVLLTSSVALITAVLNHKWQKEGRKDEFRKEQIRLLRQERNAAYSNYLVAESRLTFQASTFAEGRRSSKSADSSEVQAAIHSWEDTIERVRLLCGEELSTEVRGSW
jgi:hypothetical protein